MICMKCRTVMDRVSSRRANEYTTVVMCRCPKCSHIAAERTMKVTEECPIEVFRKLDREYHLSRYKRK